MKTKAPLSLSAQAMVIYLRFGSILSDEKKWLGPQEVLRRTGVKPSAQSNVIMRWRRRGFRIESHLGRCGRRQLLTPAQRNFLRNPETLRQWSHLTLFERARRVREKYSLANFSPYTLRNYYHRENVRYRKPEFAYGHKDRNQRQISDEQQLFSKALSRVLMKGEEEVVYIDETTFNLWQQPSRCWLARGMALTLSTARGKSLSLLTALSEQRGIIHYELFPGSNNAETFGNFLIALKLKCRGPTVVVQDNLSVHKAASVLQAYTAAFRPMFLPPYSSVLNPIERVWNMIKQEWRKTQHLHALRDFEDEDERTNYSCARLRAIIGKNDL